MSDGMRRELVYLSSHATNRYFIPNWGNLAIIVSNRDRPLSKGSVNDMRQMTLKKLHNVKVSQI